MARYKFTLKRTVFLSAAAFATLAPAKAAFAQSEIDSTYLSLTVPVLDGDVPIGVLDAKVSADGRYKVSSQSLLSVLGTVFAEDELADLEARLATIGEVTSETANDLGFALRLDMQRVVLVLDMPVENRGRTKLAISQPGRAPEPASYRQNPEPFSGYLNVNLNIIDDAELQSERTTSFGSLDSAVSMAGIVVENTALYETGTGDDAGLVRQGSRITKDFAKSGIRLAAGDVFSSPFGFNQSEDILGFSAFKNVDVFNPFVQSRPTGQQSFSLSQASDVEIYVNGALLQQSRLSAGNYDLANFPLIDGANDVRVEVRSDTGDVQVLDFTSFFDSDLLAKGSSQWEVNAGIEADRSDNGISYDSDKPVATAFYRRGISNTLTLGATTRVTDSRTNIGGQVIAATAVANIAADLSASYANEKNGMAVNVTMEPRLPESWRKSGQSLDAFFEYATRDFVVSEQTGFDRKIRAGLRYNHFLFDNKVPITASVGYTSVYGIDGESIDASLGVGFRFDNDVTLRVTPSYRRTFSGENEGAVRVSLTKTLGRRNRARATYDTRDNRAIAEYDYRSQYGGVGTLGANVVASRSDLEPETLSVAADYIANRFEANGGYSHRLDSDGASKMGRIRAGVSTAIAFAGSDFAVGRPVRDAFAIVGTHESLGDNPVIVSPGIGDAGDRARSGALGPALVPDLGSYSLARLAYDVPGIAPGYDLGAGLFEFFPPYRAGYGLTVGSDRRASSIGYIDMPDGTPLSYGVGTATSRTDEGFEPQTIFTNRSGRFGILRLVPGNVYDVTFPDAGITLQIAIPDDADGYVDVGRLKGKPQ